jgi:hypothetical protein
LMELPAKICVMIAEQALAYKKGVRWYWI